MKSYQREIAKGMQTNRHYAEIACKYYQPQISAVGLWNQRDETRIPCRDHASGHWMQGRPNSKSTGNRREEDDKNFKRNAQDCNSWK